MIEPIKTSLEKSVNKTDIIGLEEASRVSVVVEKVVAADPILANELNQEPWWQSGVLWFGSGGVLWSIGTIMTQVGQHGFTYDKYNTGIMITAIGSLASLAGVLYRRFWPGLKPMFHGWFN